MATASATAAPSALPKLVSIRDVAAWLGCSRQAIHKAVAAGRLPKPIALGSCCVRFVESELIDHLRSNGGAS